MATPGPASRDKGSFLGPLIGNEAMSGAKPTVLVIDDAPNLRASIDRLLRSLDMDRCSLRPFPTFSNPHRPLDRPARSST
jgi:hypothetical protein